MPEAASRLDPCTRQALCLTAAQLLLVLVLARSVFSRRPGPPDKLVWRGMLAGFVLLFAGVLLVGHCPVLGWALFALGLALSTAPAYGRMRRSQVEQGLLVALVLLVVAAAVGQRVGFFGSWTVQLFWATVALLLVLLLQLVCALVGRGTEESALGRWERCISAFGAMLFAVWTVHDLAAQSCQCPFRKSVTLTLDFVNLFNFASQ